MKLMKVRNSIPIFFLSLAMVIVSILGFNYLYVFMLNNVETPFGLSFNYRFYQRDDASELSPQDLIDPTWKDIRVLGLDDGRKTVFVFDPQNYYLPALENTNISGRYFTQNDYIEENDITLTTRRSNLVDLDKDNEFYEVDPQSKLYIERVDQYKNFMVQDKLVSKIYVDGANKDIQEKIGEKLKSSGYREDTLNVNPIALIIKNPDIIKSKYFFIGLLALSSYLMVIMSIYYYVNDRVGFISLSQSLGASKMDIHKKILVPFMGASLIGGLCGLILSSFIIKGQDNIIDFTYLYKLIIFLFIFHIGLFFLAEIISFNHSYKKTDEEGGIVA